ncbi:hypothetical protein ACFU44_27095 [Nocardia rhizosphaerihabitans]|uniref:hypothetical protein n=1 Tax=Nocardia rhizosphaerihabitans TaxID=1691570 RepID=UPI0036721232
MIVNEDGQELLAIGWTDVNPGRSRLTRAIRSTSALGLPGGGEVRTILRIRCRSGVSARCGSNMAQKCSNVTPPREDGDKD